MKVLHFCLHFNQSKYNVAVKITKLCCHWLKHFQMVEISIIMLCNGASEGNQTVSTLEGITPWLVPLLTSWTLLLIWGIGTIWETVWECSVWSWSHLAAVARGFDWSNIWQKTAHFRHRSCAALTQKWHQPYSFWMYWEHLLNTETKSRDLSNSN